MWCKEPGVKIQTVYDYDNSSTQKHMLIQNNWSLQNCYKTLQLQREKELISMQPI